MRALRCGLALLFALFTGHVMADYAAANRAEHAVMGHMAGDAADNRAFETALGFDRGRRQKRGQRQPEGSGQCERRSHNRNSFPGGLALGVDLMSDRTGAHSERRDLGL